MQILLEVTVLRGLPNMTSRYMTWCGLPYISATVVRFASMVFQANLRKLSPDLSLENMPNFLDPSFRVQNLEDLHLRIHSENKGSAFERDEIMRLYLVVPAISSHHATLHILFIGSCIPADLCPLFRSIDRLPALQHPSIAIPIESIHLGDPDGLSHFLNMHRSNPHTLQLRASQYGGLGLAPDPISFVYWVRDVITGTERIPRTRNLAK